MARDFCKVNNCKFMMTSAKDGTGIKELFQHAADTLYYKALEA